MFDIRAASTTRGVVAALLLTTGTSAIPAALAAQVDTARRDSVTRDTTGHRRAARLNAVTITATPVDRSEPLTVVNVSQQQIELTPFNSPWELLRETAGLEAHEQGQGPGFASDMSIRGFSSDHSTDLALWIDGVPINEPVNGHAEGYNDFNLLFPEVVTGIDVIHGPTSALYGNFAFSGIVNVRTLDRFDGAQVELTGGSYGDGGGSAIVGFDHGTTGGVFAISGSREDGWRTHSGDEQGHVHAAMFHDLNSSTTVDASVDAFITSYDSPGFLDTTLYNEHDYNFVSNFGDGGFKRHAQERVSLRTFLTPNLEWRTTLYGQEGTWNFWLSTPPGLGGLTEGTGLETHEYDGRYGYGGTTALTYGAPGVDITLGAEMRYAHAHYMNYLEDATGYRIDSAAQEIAEPAQQTSGGLFIQSGVDITKYARLILGARIDQLSSSVTQPSTDASGTLILDSTFYSQHSKGIFSPKMGMLFRPLAGIGQPNIGVFVNVSRGFRQTDGVITDPTLPFITVWDYETGVKVLEGPLTMDASLFRMDVNNDQSFDPALNETIGGGESRRNGLDVDARVHIAPGVSAFTAFTILHAFYTSYIDPDDDINYAGTPIFNTSKYVGSTTIDVALPSQIWVAQVGANFQGPYTPFEELGILRPGYILLNLAGGVRVLPRTNVLVGVRNLLDTAYRELESGAQVTPGQPRSIYVTVRYRTS
jgi:outer membrane receptor protein involved in Fe transport